ncbi:capsid scaffold protein [Cercopithecine alphaherpesvirus 9]|nr:capsid scaffold protein [Cercopithecine alphaherpesvirus 9]
MSGTSNTPTQAASVTNGGDFVLIPSAQYSRLLSTQPSGSPSLNGSLYQSPHIAGPYSVNAYPPLLPLTMQNYGYQIPHYGGQCGITNQHPGRLEMQMSAFMNALAADRGIDLDAEISNTHERVNARRNRKRNFRDCNREFEDNYTNMHYDANVTSKNEVYFPGEPEHVQRRRRVSRNTPYDRNASSKTDEIFDMVAQLRQEISELKSSALQNQNTPVNVSQALIRDPRVSILMRQLRKSQSAIPSDVNGSTGPLPEPSAQEDATVDASAPCGLQPTVPVIKDDTETFITHMMCGRM